jgi:hypothetical protein
MLTRCSGRLTPSLATVAETEPGARVPADRRKRRVLPNLCLAILIGATMLLGLIVDFARGDETITIDGATAVLLRPQVVESSIILMPGGDGRIGAAPNGVITSLTGNQLVRSRHAYVARGRTVLVIDAAVELGRAIQYMTAIARPVTVVATSRGTLRAAKGIARGALPNALVLTSGLLTSESGSAENVVAILGSPSILPPTLVIHHRHDGCRVSQPAGVEPFILWAGGRARVAWLDGGISTGDPCQGRSHHGFNGIDEEVVGLAADFH